MIENAAACGDGAEYAHSRGNMARKGKQAVAKKLKYLSKEQVMKTLGISEYTFDQCREDGSLPAGIPFGPKTFRWSQEDVVVMEWLLRNWHRMTKELPDEGTKTAKKEKVLG